jgi:hypothetical protein
MCSCVTTNAGYKTQLARWEKLSTQPGFDAYVTAFISVQNIEHVDVNSGCYAHDVGTTVDLLLVVESSGRIGAAYTDNESRKARCFRKTYVGIKMPIPPFSPFPVRIKVR